MVRGQSPVCCGEWQGMHSAALAQAGSQSGGSANGTQMETDDHATGLGLCQIRPSSSSHVVVIADIAYVSEPPLLSLPATTVIDVGPSGKAGRQDVRTAQLTANN
jgi:hypothetical protein